MTFGKIGIFGARTVFTAQEKQNIFIYVLGIMLYKFGIEAFTGAIVTLATNRYDQDAHDTDKSTRTFEKVGLLIGLNQASQCIGSIIISPLIKRWRTQIVLAATMFIFALSTAIFIILDSATGGYIKPKDFQPTHKSDFSYYGDYRTDVLIPIYCVSGITLGMVESIRRVIPANIAGDNVVKLRKMNALVHVFYEIAGVSGALITALVLIPRLGNNHAFIITPILFTASGCVWIFIHSNPEKKKDPENDIPPYLKKPKVNYLEAIIKGLLAFIQSVFIGAKMVFTNRKFLWLFAAYPLAIYSHRYIENSIAPQVGMRYFEKSGWSQILVSGSNFGELLGALFVFFFNSILKTSIPWVRLDALMLLIIWYIPFFYPPAGQVKYAWVMAATLIPIGFASAVSDISVDAYIQSSLTPMESKHQNFSPLGAVMAFLYSTHIIINSIANPLLGKYIDSVFNTTGNVHSALIFTGGVQMTIIFIVMFSATFIPKGAIAFNPVLTEEKDTNPESDQDENVNVMSDKTVDPEKIERN